MRGQIAFSSWSDDLLNFIKQKKEDILHIANEAYPSIVKRGGGAVDCSYRIIEEKNFTHFLILDLFVDTQEAMGANMINTMLEAIKSYLENHFTCEVTMAILSNLNTEALAHAYVEIPVAILKHKEESAIKMQEASDLAQVDPYRAATHNKGIMNGIDAS